MKTHFFLEASDLRAICTDGGDGAYIQTVGTGGAVPIRERARARASPPAARDKLWRWWEFVVRKGMRYPVTGKELCWFFLFPYPISNGQRSQQQSEYYYIISYINNNNIKRFYFSTFFFLYLLPSKRARRFCIYLYVMCLYRLYIIA